MDPKHLAAHFQWSFVFIIYENIYTGWMPFILLELGKVLHGIHLWPNEKWLVIINLKSCFGVLLKLGRNAGGYIDFKQL